MAPICGGGRPGNAKDYGKLPIWVFHGDADKVVPVEQSQRMVDAVLKGARHEDVLRRDFRWGRHCSSKRITSRSHRYALLSGHGGGDYGLAHDFVQAVSQQDPALLTSTIEASMESHLMGFRAEESRLSGKTMDVKPDSRNSLTGFKNEKALYLIQME